MDSWSVAAIASATTGVLTVLLTKGVDALVKWRRERRTDCTLEDKRADKAYQWVNAKWEQRVVALEAEVVSLRTALDRTVNEAAKDHTECVRVQEQLRAEIVLLKRQVGAT